MVEARSCHHSSKFTRPIMIAFAALLHVGIVIILQFDGSLRPPRDSGYPTLPARMATCSSSINFCMNVTPPPSEVALSDPYVESNLTLALSDLSTTFSSKDGTISTEYSVDRSVYGQSFMAQFVGGRNLPVTMGMTSAHAEYEGLLLGLELLLDMQSPKSSTYASSLIFEDRKNAVSKLMNAEAHLIIQGDCKTVIDQLLGKSLPRKLRDPYQVARERINLLLQREVVIQTKNNDYNVNTKFAIRIKDVQFHHIPRQQNVLCDAVCGKLMTLLCSNAERALRQTLHQILQTRCTFARSFDNHENHRFERFRSSTMSNLQHLRDGNMKEEPIDPHQDGRRQEHDIQSPTLDSIITDYFSPKTSRIRYSVRPSLYRLMAISARRLHLWDTLHRIGESMMDEAKAISGSSKLSMNGVQRSEKRDVVEQLRVIDDQRKMLRSGIQYQIIALTGMNRHKEASALRRKHRVVLAARKVAAGKPQQLASTSESGTAADNFSWQDAMVENEIGVADLDVLCIDDNITADTSLFDTTTHHVNAWLEKAIDFDWKDGRDNRLSECPREVENTLWIVL